ncbi:hypothetical protein [Acidithiobacillus thiooxidans]|uniref:Uncharacterized protein n=1 Tax=Acidithiobacillus thiooxidans ATCC 19377 TaxID=637390 RepID=A0A543Q218_ACITH|nr:hypothetical protein [Acidithiobacillus thiooxidans]MDX5935497.1 hypothetical protein [Acidithiobacillus thiooxidans]TQN50361.1 hypothetical protein DLNHIDIE_00214 [Acidithiobacillus thiooxidans ATCC 19377]
MTIFQELRQQRWLSIALTSWACIGLIFLSRLTSWNYSWADILFLWLIWNLMVMIPAWTEWMHEWPWGLLNRKRTLEELKDAMMVAENLRLGGRFGSWVFYALAWMSLLLVLLVIPLYFYGAWAAYYRLKLTVFNGFALVDIALAATLTVCWLGYTLFLHRWRSYSAFGRCQKQNAHPRWSTYKYPSAEFLLRNEHEAHQFLSLFVADCPLPNLNEPAYLSIPWNIFPTVILTALHFFVNRLGVNAAIVPFLDAAAGLVLLALSFSMVPWLFEETSQWWSASEICPCAYRPLLRLVQHTRALRG